MKKINLREHQLIALEILKYFDKVCSENNIRYSLGGGTLIGAARHQGFIPWDDDVDVYMCRDEYQKFVEVWKKMHHKRYEISLAEDITGFMSGSMTKIFDVKSLLIDVQNRKSPVFIDIFILDGVPNNANLIYEFMKKHKKCKTHFFSCRKRWFKSKEGTWQQKLFSTLSHYLFNKMQSNLRIFQKQYPFEKSEYIGLVLSDYGCWQKSYMPKNYFDDVTYLDFEGNKYPVMKEYHKHLTEYYGDYMQLPPEKDRNPTHAKEVYLLEE